MEFTLEQFMHALQDTIIFSLSIRGQELEAYESAQDVPMNKLPAEIQNAWSTMLDGAMSEAMEAVEIFENIAECLEEIAAGNVPHEVKELMKQYFDAAKEMYEAVEEEDTIAKNKARYELECLEDDLESHGYYVLGGYEAYCNMVDEAKFAETDE